ncbi:MAG: orotate phosphoribosyltransferase [Euryarchaeota archaeon]|nr:orotate phosphoribosyltransferase [Euryarchaeota archaeon]
MTVPGTETAPDARLKELIVELTLFRNEEGFTLASGRKSTFLFNLKNLYGEPEAARLVTNRLLDTLGTLEFDLIAGIELGAVFPVTAAILQSATTDKPIRGFVVRKKAKGHGSLNRIECLKEIPQGSRVVPIDDVTTTGGSLLEAVQVARDLGCTVTHAITLIDREEGANERLAEEGITLVPLYTKSDFLGPDVK